MTAPPIVRKKWFNDEASKEGTTHKYRYHQIDSGEAKVGEQEPAPLMIE